MKPFFGFVEKASCFKCVEKCLQMCQETLHSAPILTDLILSLHFTITACHLL